MLQGAESTATGMSWKHPLSEFPDPHPSTHQAGQAGQVWEGGCHGLASCLRFYTGIQMLQPCQCRQDSSGTLR